LLYEEKEQEKEYLQRERKRKMDELRRTVAVRVRIVKAKTREDE